MNSFARAPKAADLAAQREKLMDWLQVHQAYGVINMLERAGVWDFCYGRGEPFARLTPEQEERLRERYLPEVEALEELLAIDLSAWKQPRARRVVENSRRAGCSDRPTDERRHQAPAARNHWRRSRPHRHHAGCIACSRATLICPTASRRRSFSTPSMTRASTGTRITFATRPARRKIAEICPYFFHPLAPRRIKTHIPNCRIITTLRDPVDHSFSAYKLVRHFAWARGSFDEVLKSRPNLGSGNRYASHLKTWFDLFGRENVLVTMYDELRAQPQSYLDRVTDFMGVERIALSARPDIGDDVHSFARAPKVSRSPAKRRRMMYWLQGHQAYGVINLLERAGVWDFCYGRGEPFGRLTPEQEQQPARALPARSRGARRIARHRSLRVEKTASAPRNGRITDERNFQHRERFAAARLYRRRSRPHRHDVAARSSQGPRQSAGRNQGDRLFHDQLFQGYRVVRASLSRRRPRSARLARSIHISASPRLPSASRFIFRDAKSFARSAIPSSESIQRTNSGVTTR